MRVEFKGSEGGAAAPSAPQRARGGGARLAAALVALTNGHGVITEHRQHAWASVTFNGSRQKITLEFAGVEAVAEGEFLIAALPEHEFKIPRQLVADAAVISVDHILFPLPRMTLCCEILMLEDI